MRDRGRKETGRPVKRLLVLALAPLAVATVDLPALGPGKAEAQEGPFGFVGRIFGGGGRPRRYIDEPPAGYSPRPKYYIDPPVAPQRRQTDRQRPAPQRASPSSDDAPSRSSASTPSARSAAAAATTRASTPPAPKPVEKAADAKTILVVGDFMALSLAKGLDASVIDKAGIRIADRTDGSSGLVRDDHFDWPARIGGIIDEEKPAAVVVMLGTNDRQTLRESGEAFDLRSEEWTAEYEKRIDALAKAIGARRLPLIWVGLPALKSANASDDLAYFNELYRQAATEAGGEFVDVWDGFVDEDGAFTSTGPDIAGQPAKLRNADGITMTPQGARKLAFFAEKPLEKLFGTGFEGVAPAAEPEVAKALPQNPANATSVPAVAMNSPSLDGGETLLGGSAEPVGYPSQPSPREKLVLSGVALPPTSGRADNFAWNVKAGPVGPIGPNLPAGPYRPEPAAEGGTAGIDGLRTETAKEKTPPPRPASALPAPAGTEDPTAAPLR